MTNPSVSEKLLQMLIEKSVSEKLNNLTREFGELTKGMSEGEKQQTALMILGMVENATNEFFNKMRARIEARKV